MSNSATTATGAMLYNIQVLRAVAALMVVSLHSSEMLPWSRWTSWGGAGVDVFFVISGFIMVHVTKEGTGGWDFFKNRLIRITPLYWLFTFITFGLALLLPTLFASTRADYWDLIRSLLFVPYEKASGLTQPLLFVGWSLNYEMFFYILFALGMALGRKGFWATLLALACLVGAGPLGSGVLWDFYTAPLMLEFGAGMLLAKLRPSLSPAFAAIMIVGGLAAFPLLIQGPGDQGLSRVGPAIAVVAGALALEARGIRFRWPLVQQLGDASYAIYLSHPFVVGVLAAAAVRIPAMATALALIAIMGSAAFGWLVHMLVERPIHKRLKAPRTSPSPAAA
jgi:exopolysaccharide production protein ExoZ